MEKEPTKKRTEIMRIRGTDNRTLKDDLKSRRQLIVIRVNGWTDRGRNEKTKQTITRIQIRSNTGGARNMPNEDPMYEYN